VHQIGVCARYKGLCAMCVPLCVPALKSKKVSKHKGLKSVCHVCHLIST